MDENLEALEQIVNRAGKAGCDVLALPEDTLGTLLWEAAHPMEVARVLPEAVRRMLDRLGRAAAAHQIYLVCSNDTAEPDGTMRNPRPGQGTRRHLGEAVAWRAFSRACANTGNRIAVLSRPCGADPLGRYNEPPAAPLPSERSGGRSKTL